MSNERCTCWDEPGDINCPVHSTPGHLLGKRVEIEGEGRGTIVDATQNLVGILLKGRGCRVLYVPKEKLKKVE